MISQASDLPTPGTQGAVGIRVTEGTPRVNDHLANRSSHPGYAEEEEEEEEEEEGVEGEEEEEEEEEEEGASQTMSLRPHVTLRC